MATNLHLAKNMEELNRRTNLQEEILKYSVKQLLNSAEKLFTTAAEYEQKKDEELAYVNYMKFVALCKKVRDTGCKKALEKNTNLAKNMKVALTNAENLSASLEKRYNSVNENHKAASLEKVFKPVAKVKQLDNVAEETSAKRKYAEDGFIQCTYLNSLIKEKSSTFLVIDVRSKENFSKACICGIPHLINIPEDFITKGLTAGRISEHVSLSDLASWNRRHSFDFVIIHDWMTESRPLPDAISLVISAMMTWDVPKHPYKCEHPLILKGGLEMWFAMYPQLTTARPAECESLNIPSMDTSHNSALEFAYPDLDSAFLATPSPESHTPRENGLAAAPLPSPTTEMLTAELKGNKYANSQSTDQWNPPSGTQFQAAWTTKPSGQPPAIPDRLLKPVLKEKHEVEKKKQRILEDTIRNEEEAIEMLKKIELESETESIFAPESAVMQEWKRLDEEGETLRSALAASVEREKQLMMKVKELEEAAKRSQNDAIPSHETTVNTSQVQEDNAALQEKVSALRKERKEQERRMKEAEEKKIEMEKEEAKRKQALDEARKAKPAVLPGNEPKTHEPSTETVSDALRTTRRGGESTYKTRLKSSPRGSPVRGESNLKRCHSDFNLSVMEPSEEDVKAVPYFDRTLKPFTSPRSYSLNIARKRNFEPKYGSVSKPRTGLRNLGNSCYMNSVIQCLNNTSPLNQYFFGEYTDDINTSSEQHGDVAIEFAAVVQALWTGQYRSIFIWDFKRVVGRGHPPFGSFDQQDAHEFLLKLMDWLHEDLNVAQERGKHSQMEEQNFDNVSDCVAADMFVKQVALRDKSVISKMFYGLHRSVITCRTCCHMSLTFEPFSVLTLSFPSSERFTLEEMLDYYYKVTEIEYKCSKCKTMRKCVRKLDIFKPPEILVIHLNRFEQNVLITKRQHMVSFPIESLSLSKYTCENGHITYSLYGVSNHRGTITGGHYTAFCRSSNNSSWCKYDDEMVSEISTKEVRTAEAYILFYTSRF